MSVTYTCNKIYGDIYGRTTTVLVDRRLKLMPSAQAGIVNEPDGGISLMSYATKVATVDGEGWLTCSGTYGSTTRRHINRFLKEFDTPCGYYDAKRCYEHDEAINIYTGEVKTMQEYIEYLENLARERAGIHLVKTA